MNQLHQKLNREAKKFSLTDAEKKLAWSRISARIGQGHIPSPYWSVLSMRITAALLIVLLVSGGTAFASGSALPGDILYPVKVSVVEPLGEAFIVSEDGKISYNESLIEKRIQEAQQLADETRLSEYSRQALEKELEKRAEKVQKLAEKIREKDGEKAERLAREFESILLAHSDILEELGDESEDEETKTGARLLASALREGRYGAWPSFGMLALMEKEAASAPAEGDASLALMSAPVGDEETNDGREEDASFSFKSASREGTESAREGVSEEAEKRAWKLYEDVTDEFEDAENLTSEAKNKIGEALKNLAERLENADRESLPVITRELLRLETFLEASERFKSRDITRPLFANDRDEDGDDEDGQGDDGDDEEDEGEDGLRFWNGRDAD